MSWIVVRVRSDVKVERSIRETMHHLNLTRVNHAVIIPKNDQYRGMLQKAKDYITWGEADQASVESMLRHRGRMVGGAPLTDEAVAEGGVHADIGAMATAIASGEGTGEGRSQHEARLPPSPAPRVEGLGRHQAFSRQRRSPWPPWRCNRCAHRAHGGTMR